MKVATEEKKMVKSITLHTWSALFSSRDTPLTVLSCSEYLNQLLPIIWSVVVMNHESAPRIKTYLPNDPSLMLLVDCRQSQYPPGQQLFHVLTLFQHLKSLQRPQVWNATEEKSKLFRLILYVCVSVLYQDANFPHEQSQFECITHTYV